MFTVVPDPPPGDPQAYRKSRYRADSCQIPRSVTPTLRSDEVDRRRRDLLLHHHDRTLALGAGRIALARSEHFIIRPFQPPPPVAAAHQPPLQSGHHAALALVDLEVHAMLLRRPRDP